MLKNKYLSVILKNGGVHMKSIRLTVMFLLVGLLIISAIATARAAESWVSDPATGCKIGWVSYFTLSSASWSGPVVDGKAEGKGTLTLTVRDKDGKDWKYWGEAEMVAGLLDGKVTMKWSHGVSYDGDYKAGKREGKGITKWSNGQIYEGDYKADQVEGKGIMKEANGRIYEGEWKAGQHDGKGVMKWPNGQTYNGDWKKDMMNGKGILKFPNGAIYEGDLLNDNLNGYGVLKESNGKVIYDGQWKDGKYDSGQQL